MSAGDSAYLLVRAGGRRVGLALAHVIEVLDPGEAHPVPSVEPAVRGVARVRGRVLPVIHLGALLDGLPCPPARGETAVLVDLDGRRLCLEVDEAEIVSREFGLPVPPETAMPWAVAVARHPDGLVPLLDLTPLGARMSEATR
ncbi:MAG TPA: chemotaxis protein CheW [Gemmatimonadales bacterium]